MTADHIAAIRADAKRAADAIAYSTAACYGTAPSAWAVLLGALAGNADLACDEVERLTARVAELEGENARLKDSSPGTPLAIIEALFRFAEAECGHNPLSIRHALTTVRDWVAKAGARVAELEAAIRPFAVMAATPGLTPDDGVTLWPLDYGGDTSATVGDLRRAAAALGEKAP